MSDSQSGGGSSPSNDSAQPPPRPGVSRAVGVVISAITAVAVAAIGNVVVPQQAPTKSNSAVTRLDSRSATPPAAPGPRPEPTRPNTTVDVPGPAADVASAAIDAAASAAASPVPATAIRAARPTTHADDNVGAATGGSDGVDKKLLVRGSADGGDRANARAVDSVPVPSGTQPPASDTTTPDSAAAFLGPVDAIDAAVADPVKPDEPPPAKVALDAQNDSKSSDGKAALKADPKAEGKSERKLGAEPTRIAEAKPDTDPRSKDGTLPPEDRGPVDCSLPDKDIARESGRRNSPTLCAGPGTDKVSLIIPIKGTLERENHELRSATREVRINLPAGDALLTQRQYKVRKAGFKDLRILPTDSGGTRLRLKLQPGTGEPVFDIKDGYAKVTITAPRGATRAN